MKVSFDPEEDSGSSCLNISMKIAILNALMFYFYILHHSMF